eukprot:gene4082-2930_t
MPATVFPLHARGIAPGVQEEHLAAALRQQLEQQQRRQVLQRAPRYFLDTPISSGDVDRWSASFREAAARAGCEHLFMDVPEAVKDTVPFYLAEEALAMTQDDRINAVHPLAPLPAFSLAGAQRPSMVKVLRHRREWLPYRQRIALHQQRMQLLDVMSKHVAVSLVGGAGSGKTLQLPQILSETEALKKTRIILVSANESAARMTVLRLRQERGEDVQQSRSVASVLSLEADAVSHTSIVVVTAEVLLRQLLCDPSLVGVSTVIIDDIHLRTEATELCLALLRELLLAHAGAKLAPCGTSHVFGSPLHVVVNCLDEESAQQIHDSDAENGAEGVTPPVVFYVDETVQWLHKCSVEQRSSLIRVPERELEPFQDKVEVVTQIMTAPEADFFDEKKCRHYWCGLMLDALTHFDRAERELVSDTPSTGLGVVVIVVPQLESSIRIVRDELLQYIHRRNGEVDEETSSAMFVLHNLFEEDDAADQLFFHLLPSLNEGRQKGVRHVLVGSAPILQTVLPPSMEVGLVIDFARTSTCMFDTETAADHWLTEYASFTQLRYRHQIAEGVARRSFPPMVIQLIPKTILHNPQRRRLNTDAHHPVFRLSSWQYLQLFQVLQLREDTCAAAAERGFKLSVAPSIQLGTSIASRISSVFAQYFIGIPAPTSKKYEQSRRIFQRLEVFLRASGHVSGPKRVSSAPAGAPVLQPLGVLSCCWLFPIVISRLLSFGVLFHRPLEATAVAAIWLSGDPFLANHKSKNSDEDEWAMEAAITEHSDAASLFYLYRMWLDQRQSGSEQEEAFLTACKIHKSTLERTLKYHANLFFFLLRGGILRDPANQELLVIATPEERAEYIGRAVVSLPENAFMEDAVQAVISSAVYPHCGIPLESGAVKLYEGAYSSSTGSRAQHVGVLAIDSVLHDREALKEVHHQPIVYLARLMSNRTHNSAVATAFPVLEQNMKLHQAASVVFCGEENEVPHHVPNRCRGWSSPLTQAWRRTQQASPLPPVPEVPPVSIPLQPFDVIQSKQVVLVVDGQLEFVLRSTTAQWLRQLRQYIHLSLRALVSLPKDMKPEDAQSRMAAFASMAEEVAEAWGWWSHRMAEGVEWLREERAKTPPDGEGVNDAANAPRLFPYHVFQTMPGLPVTAKLPEKEKMSSRGEEALPAASASGPEVYTGKLPSEDIDRIIQTVVSCIADLSRTAEAKFLKENPDSFSFLDPSNELHEYYLYLLKKEAPDIDMLGDDIEQLLVFLTQLEQEVRADMGLPPEEAPQEDEREGNENSMRIEELGNEEEVFSGGVQEEAAYSLIQKSVVRSIQRPPAAKKPTAPPPSAPAASLDPTEAPGLAEGDEGESSPAGHEEVETMQGLHAQELLSLVEHGGSGSTAVLSDLGPAPTATELTALLSGGVLPTAAATPPPRNPFSQPPPPLPAAMVEANPPSILAFPLPEVSGNIPALLSNALGDALGIQVGPTVIVGKVARISLPNRKVLRRCIELESFQCRDKTVYLVKNDRIIDNPNPTPLPMGGILGGAPMGYPPPPPFMPQHGALPPYYPPPQPAAPFPPSQPVLPYGYYDGPLPPVNEAEEDGEIYNAEQERPNGPSKPIGVLSDSEDDSSDDSDFTSDDKRLLPILSLLYTSFVYFSVKDFQLASVVRSPATMASPEEVFLRNREEREKTRLAATKGEVDTIRNEQREAALKEIEDFTAAVEHLLAQGDHVRAAEILGKLRRLVQDAAATSILTSYEMAKANNNVSKLNELVSTRSDAGSSTPSTTNDDLGKGEKKKKFRFSAAALKRDPPASKGTDLSSPSVATLGASPQGSQVAADGASYGPLKGQTLFIPSARALFVSACEDCTIFTVPIAGSAFVSDCKSCRLYIACSQLRLKNCENVDVYVWVPSTPIIEHCSGMRFGPYTCWRGLLKGSVPISISISSGHADKGGESRLFESHRRCVQEIGEMRAPVGDDAKDGEEGWKWVEDFQWLKKTASPNWRTLETSEFEFRDEAFPEAPSK